MKVTIVLTCAAMALAACVTTSGSSGYLKPAYDNFGRASCADGYTLATEAGQKVCVAKSS